MEHYIVERDMEYYTVELSAEDINAILFGLGQYIDYIDNLASDAEASEDWEGVDEYEAQRNSVGELYERLSTAGYPATK